jgi:hypothetical protein
MRCMHNGQAFEQLKRVQHHILVNRYMRVIYDVMMCILQSIYVL